MYYESVYFQSVNLNVCELYPNKAVIKKISKVKRLLQITGHIWKGSKWNLIADVKNSVDWPKNRVNTPEQWISELEDGSEKVT